MNIRKLNEELAKMMESVEDTYESYKSSKKSSRKINEEFPKSLRKDGYIDPKNELVKGHIYSINDSAIAVFSGSWKNDETPIFYYSNGTTIGEQGYTIHNVFKDVTDDYLKSMEERPEVSNLKKLKMAYEYANSKNESKIRKSSKKASVNENAVATYIAPEEELYETKAVIELHNGKYYIYFLDNGGNVVSSAGSYATEDEAKQQMKKIRPDYRLQESKIRTSRKSNMNEGWLKVLDPETADVFRKYAKWSKNNSIGLGDDKMLSGTIKHKSGLVYQLMWDKYTDEIFILEESTKSESYIRRKPSRKINEISDEKVLGAVKQRLKRAGAFYDEEAKAYKAYQKAKKDYDYNPQSKRNQEELTATGDAWKYIKSQSDIENKKARQTFDRAGRLKGDKIYQKLNQSESKINESINAQELEQELREYMSEPDYPDTKSVVDEAKANGLEVYGTDHYSNALTMDTWGMPDVDVEALNITYDDVQLAVEDFANALSDDYPDFGIWGRMGRHWGLSNLDKHIQFNYDEVIPIWVNYIIENTDEELEQDYEDDLYGLVNYWSGDLEDVAIEKAKTPFIIEPEFLQQMLDIKSMIENTEKDMQDPSYWDGYRIEESYKPSRRRKSVNNDKVSARYKKPTNSNTEVYEDLEKTKRQIDKIVVGDRDPKKVKTTIELLADDEREKEQATDYAVDRLTESLLNTRSNSVLNNL